MTKLRGIIVQRLQDGLYLRDISKKHAEWDKDPTGAKVFDSRFRAVQALDSYYGQDAPAIPHYCFLPPVMPRDYVNVRVSYCGRIYRVTFTPDYARVLGVWRKHHLYGTEVAVWPDKTVGRKVAAAARQAETLRIGRRL